LIGRPGSVPGIRQDKYRRMYGVFFKKFYACGRISVFRLLLRSADFVFLLPLLLIQKKKPKGITMPYPEQLCAPMRAELTSVGFEELRTPEEVKQAFDKKEGTMLVVVNSVCGCAAGAARPGIRIALEESGNRPSMLTTVFAGQDVEAVAEARKHMLPYPPSSPSIAFYKNGDLVHFIERHQIEGRNARMIADHLKAVFEEYC
jgi:putative YphP/YqiW family bacilliredoxin